MPASATLCFTDRWWRNSCVQLVWGSWGLGFLKALINILKATNLDFCENHAVATPAIQSALSLPLLCCSWCLHRPHGPAVFQSMPGFDPPPSSFFLCSLSHHSEHQLHLGQETKTFSTCLSHLTAVSFFFGSGFLRYLVPTSGSPLELIFPVQYGVVTPMLRSSHLQPEEQGSKGCCEEHLENICDGPDEENKARGKWRIRIKWCQLDIMRVLTKKISLAFYASVMLQDKLTVHMKWAQT